jgi:hypothetical protein
MAGFVTLGESYMGIELHSNLWNYFCTRLQWGSDTETVALAI